MGSANPKPLGRARNLLKSPLSQPKETKLTSPRILARNADIAVKSQLRGMRRTMPQNLSPKSRRLVRRRAKQIKELNLKLRQTVIRSGDRADPRRVMDRQLRKRRKRHRSHGAQKALEAEPEVEQLHRRSPVFC